MEFWDGSYGIRDRILFKLGNKGTCTQIDTYWRTNTIQISRIQRVSNSMPMIFAEFFVRNDWLLVESPNSIFQLLVQKLTKGILKFNRRLIDVFRYWLPRNFLNVTARKPRAILMNLEHFLCYLIHILETRWPFSECFVINSIKSSFRNLFLFWRYLIVISNNSFNQFYHIIITK